MHRWYVIDIVVEVVTEALSDQTGSKQQHRGIEEQEQGRVEQHLVYAEACMMETQIPKYYIGEGEHRQDECQSTRRQQVRRYPPINNQRLQQRVPPLLYMPQRIPQYPNPHVRYNPHHQVKHIPVDLR